TEGLTTLSDAAAAEASGLIPTVSTAQPVQPNPSSTISTTGAVPPIPSSTTSTPTGQIVQLSAAQIGQLITPRGQPVGGVQQILSIGGQNILVSGSGPGVVGNLSLRYGKILKGSHKYFCSKCQRPFTQKESLKRHELENCPTLDKKQKLRHKCADCPEHKGFSSKQYLTEHIYEVHLKKFLYHCNGCGKGYFKHCNLAFHKKSCLAVLAPNLGGIAQPEGFSPENPSDVVTTSTTASVDTVTTAASAATTTTATVMTTEMTAATTSSTHGDPLIGGQSSFSFSDPMFLPDLGGDDA
ncbi:MAG: hypothetical protein MJE68_15915, partial [Proteobacteria bacterium]|nr:hypothetical protein [Pseudomonadota bacterium]